MRSSTVRWTTTIAAAALMALPITASAQTPTQGTSPQSQAAPQQPPTTQPPTTPPPTTQPPTTQPPAMQPPPTQPAAQPDQAAAKQHLTEARESLSQLTSLPEAAKLQGEARTQVSQVIANFNELITTQENWRAAYAKLDANLTALIGADPANANNPTTVGTSGTAGTAGTAGTTGTSGTTGTTGTATTATSGIAQLDPAIRAKLVEFRKHLSEFEKASGGAISTEPAPDAAMPPSAATGTTTNPANPTATTGSASATDPTKPTSGTAATAGVAGAAGTSGSAASSNPTGSMTPADRESAASAVSMADAQKELDAISAILSKSKTGALTKAETTQLKKHVENLRTLLNQK